MTPLRVAIVADLTEEQWPSMDLVAEMLVQHLTKQSVEANIRVDLLRPALVPSLRSVGRFVNRFWHYGRWLRARADSHDVFHIVDHSYAHLVHALPAARTVVTCHDIDAFLPLVDPALTRSRLPKFFVRASLSGLRRAARIACVSQATCEDLRRYHLVPPARLALVPNGTHAAFTAAPDGEGDAAIGALLGDQDERLDLLHMGSTIPRKRIDLLLRIVAAAREADPRIRLVKAGGRLTDEQHRLARRLGLEEHLIQMPFLDRQALAALYRHSAIVLVTSDREGFGLPVVEALASGTPVIATDLAALREAGGTAARYRTLGDVPGWRDEILDVIGRRADPALYGRWQADAANQARQFNWEANAASMIAIYRDLAAGAPRTASPQ
jgi:glycosyltransferase involved in cell wall biosynthesis